MTLLSRTRRQEAIEAAFADAAAVGAALGEVKVPADIAAWLGRLHTLIGVPFGYLVGDQGQLPPESIRFFRLDDNWIRALLDGAFSLGRNLTATAESRGMSLDQALVFDPTTGLLDVSLAAAWTIGRLVALQDSTYASALYAWKRGLTQAVVDAAERRVIDEILGDVLAAIGAPSGDARPATRPLLHETMRLLAESEPR